MGWGSGSSLMSQIITALKKRVPDKKQRKAIYKDIIEAMENCDWDTQSECLGEDKVFDEALDELHPEWRENENAD